MTIDLQDIPALLDEVERFARTRIGAAVARPEIPLDGTSLAQLTAEAVGMGLLSLSADPEGYGLWEAPAEKGGMLLSLRMLRHVGEANAGVAFAWHRTALAAHVARHLRLPLNTGAPLGTTLVPTGHIGLARTSLARWLTGQAPSGEDLALLVDWLNRREHDTVLYAHPDWETLLLPVWHQDTIAWQSVSRSDWQVADCARAHGFDGLAAFRLREPPSSTASVVGVPDNPRALFASVLKMDMLGLMAIGGGALARAQTMATDYAAVRRQGGKLIAAHAAVQQLLTDIELARLRVDQALGSFALALDEVDLCAVAASRIDVHKHLCHAANQAVQVHGGIGYMRDLGVEKIVRDQNMLRLQAGGIHDARLFVAGWKGAGA